MKLERVVSVNADITDVANWFLLKEDMSHKKIQKLCYYAEAWSETLLDAPICRNNEFQAWVHGPVNLKLWNLYKDGYEFIYNVLNQKKIRYFLNFRILSLKY